MRRYLYLVALIPSLVLCSTPSFGQAWSGVLAPARATDWGQAGIPGGIPSATWPNCTTTACNTLYGGTVTATSIRSALASAPNNTVVRIPAGTFTLSGSVYSNRSNVVLRGAGPTQTVLNMGGYSILFGLGTNGQGTTPGGTGVTNLSTLTRGSRVLTVASTAGLSAGQIVQVDQTNESWVNVNGFSGSENAGRNGLSFSGSNARAQLELVRIQSVDSSTQITIEEPGLLHDYSAGRSPQVFYWSAAQQVNYNGIEDLRVNSSTSFSVTFPFCNLCWAKNIAVVSTAVRGSIYFMWDYRPEVRDSYVQQSNAPGAPTQYGIECDTCTLGKIENNIIFGVTAPVMLETSSGVVTAYNYILNTAADNQFSGVTSHRVHNYLDLVEGNVAANLSWDNIWGGGSHHTVFRNRFSGRDPNKTNYRIAVQVSSFHRFTNVVANVLGDSSFHTRYESTSSSCSDDTVYQLAISNNCGSMGTADPTTYSSLMRWGNWDAATWKANGNTNGIRYCMGSGVGNPACTASETASTDPTFPGLADPRTTFPASFYLMAKPAWWGDVPWPPIGPDVTGGSIPNAGGRAHKIPAQLCYEATTKSSGGFLTAFDANACYNNAPRAPTDVTVRP